MNRRKDDTNQFNGESKTASARPLIIALVSLFLAGLVTLCCLGGVLILVIDPTKHRPGDPVAIKAPPAPHDDTREIIAEYSLNGDAADGRYKGATVNVIGTVHSTSRGPDGFVAVIVSAGKNAAFTAGVDQPDEAEAFRFQKSVQVKIRGVVSGGMRDRGNGAIIYLERSKIAPISE